MVAPAPTSEIRSGGLRSCRAPPAICMKLINVTIQDFVADVVSELFFRNVEPVSKETMFIFPVDSNTVVHSFYATMGDTRIEAMLWEKEEQLCKATAGMENLRYLQDQWDLWGPVFACFLGTLPPNREVTISLCYVQELPLQPDGAAQFCWPHELLPQNNYLSEVSSFTFSHLFLPADWMSSEEVISENLHFNICLKSAHGVSHVAINSSYTPLQYTAPDQTSAEVTKAKGQGRGLQFKKPPCFPTHTPGSLLGDPVVMVTLMPDIPEEVPNPGQPGEFLFLMDRSLFQDAQLLHVGRCSNTLLFLLKSLPLGCYFNIYSFGATFKAFYPRSVEYTQESMDNAVGRISSICPDLGGCDLLGLLRSIYNTPHLHGHARQVSGEPRCPDFCPAITHRPDCARGTQLVRATPPIPLSPREPRHQGPWAEPWWSCDLRCPALCPQVLKCLKRALKLAAEEVSLSWTLPCGLEVEVLGGTPQSIFQGQHSLLYAQIHGQAQVRAGTTVTPSYLPIASQQSSGALHRGVEKGHLSVIVPTLLLACSPTACKPPPPPISSLKHVNPREFVLCSQNSGPWSSEDIAECQELVALQNVDGSWALSSGLASVLEVDEAEIKGKMPGEVLEPSIWATVLALTWLNRNDKCYRDFCELLEAKAVTWLCSRLDKCLEAANTLLGSTVEPSVFRL
uniref:VIT domain-containing protein n=1 Tax=Aquila chrysaetos chrysaetos TaxID=223781 RepID=A0A663DN88_AQUCH